MLVGEGVVGGGVRGVVSLVGLLRSVSQLPLLSSSSSSSSFSKPLLDKMFETN